MPLFKVKVAETVAKTAEWLVRAVDEADARARYHAGQRSFLDDEELETVDSSITDVQPADDSYLADIVSDHRLAAEEGLTRLDTEPQGSE